MKNFVSEVGFEVAGVMLQLGFDSSGRPMMAIGVDRTKNSADQTIAPLDDEAIVRLLAYANRALVSRLETVKKSVEDLEKPSPGNSSEVINFKPKV